jgi:hypothetical protein
MLYDVVSFLLVMFLGVLGVSFIVGAFRVLLGSNEAYELNRKASKGPLRSMVGDIRGPYVDGSLRGNRGISYSLKLGGDVTYHGQSKINRESLKETRV